MATATATATMTKAEIEPVTRTVETTINYFHDTGLPLVPMVIGGSIPPKPQPKIAWPVRISDVTGREDEYTLDQQGFQYVKHRSVLDINDDDETIRRVHYPEMEELVRKVILETKGLPPPSSIHILTHIIRRGPKDGEVSIPGVGPLYGVHVDQSLGAAPGVVGRFLGDAAAELLQKPRYQIINTWRPLRPVTRDCFAVSDARSIPDSDLIHVPIIFPNHETEALEVRPPAGTASPASASSSSASASHRWYYKERQQPDDVLFFTQVDSCDLPHVVARRVPHCAFNDPSRPPGYGEPRVSIEVRALVFYDSVL
ncbi:hypothetical protein PVAG01_10883 [Phlyctema vagabunda]|uniref:Uncharacterized protein n=1 Tax=Phlyctema vagabunda TaxID=108571 RepID=A0ABR4P3I9_9HELO